MKTYTINQLKSIAKDQGYKLAALEDQQGRRILSFNQLKTSIDKHLTLIPTRLKSEINPDGVYFVLMAQNISKAGKDPDKFPILKGKVSPDDLVEAEKRSLPLTLAVSEPAVLTYAQAIEYNRVIASNESEIKQLKWELEQAKLTIAELEAELDEEDEGLSEGGPVNPIAKFLSDTMPTIIPMIEKHFELQEKRINLDEMKLKGGGGNKSSVKKGDRIKQIVPGTQPHMDLIWQLYNSDKEGDEEKLNTELDKLERTNPEVYRNVLKRLGMEEDIEQEEVEEGGGDE